ncbi:MAG: bifunctional pyr operon transcriptional regulator/uracil phosphoribosyltransferase PyrR [Bacteroidetes bacterium]|jgi:pyrimidine operon attenuation protein/uracil phosphoribosyltransferase|nr:bifunctional pyr operon transcriptional regulator/uracil phosphoribosyltransferase PyrR [Bacteroidota bacterium]
MNTASTTEPYAHAEAMRQRIHRLSLMLAELHQDQSPLVLLGIQPRGVYLAQRLQAAWKSHMPTASLDFGVLDPTFYRDDFNQSKVLIPEATQLSFSLENRRVVLVDDVLFTGRTIRAALDAVHTFGRPEWIKLLVLVERRFARQLPIHPDFFGWSVDAFEGQKVRVHWAEQHGKDAIWIENKP